MARQGRGHYAYAPVESYGWGVVTQQWRASEGFIARDHQLRRFLFGIGVAPLSVSIRYLVYRAVVSAGSPADHRMNSGWSTALRSALRSSGGQPGAGGFSYSVSGLRATAQPGQFSAVARDYADKVDEEGKGCAPGASAPATSGWAASSTTCCGCRR